MAENDKDSGLSEGTNQSTNSGGSGGEGVQQSSFDAAKMQSLLGSLGSKLEEIDARTKALQGDKDRGVNKTQKEVEQLKSKIAEYEKLKKQGFDSDDAVDEVDFRSTIREIKDQLGRLNPVQAGGSGKAESVTDEAAQVIEKAQLSASDPKVIELVRQHGGNPIDLAVQLGSYKGSMANRPSPDLSAVPAMQSHDAPASTGMNTEDVEKKSKQLSTLYLQPTKNAVQIKALEKELEDYWAKG